MLLSSSLSAVSYMYIYSCPHTLSPNTVDSVICVYLTQICQKAFVLRHHPVLCARYKSMLSMWFYLFVLFFFFGFIWQFDLSFRQHVLRSADVRADRSIRTHCPGQFFNRDDRKKSKTSRLCTFLF
jgi:hypothetical protein